MPSYLVPPVAGRSRKLPRGRLRRRSDHAHNADYGKLPALDVSRAGCPNLSAGRPRAALAQILQRILSLPRTLQTPYPDQAPSNVPRNRPAPCIDMACPQRHERRRKTRGGPSAHQDVGSNVGSGAGSPDCRARPVLHRPAYRVPVAVYVAAGRRRRNAANMGTSCTSSNSSASATPQLPFYRWPPISFRLSLASCSRTSLGDGVLSHSSRMASPMSRDDVQVNVRDILPSSTTV
jgi:hypothetical protein